ncbi:peptide ligase PGM1-related protein [Streptomyces sp. NPDC101151]|uniref:peptide ligase PGM1-related protein n=1 Tax=Streptomyces sp. NPDC101151 TaxID=3366115 RepID=UPI00380BACE7
MCTLPGHGIPRDHRDDAYLTPDRDIFFCETNGRITGATHILDVFRTRLLSAELRERRVFFEHFHLPVPSFEQATDQLQESGLAYEPETGTGVILVADLVEEGATVIYCVVAPDLNGAEKMQEQLHHLFPSHAQL